MAEKIQIETIVKAPIEKVWEMYTSPEHIVKWNNASDDWHTVSADNDLTVGGKFLSRMEAKDGSAGFDFSGVYTVVENTKYIEYKLDDDRVVQVTFSGEDDSTKVEVSFDAESENSIEVQKEGWQSILDSFRDYAEKTH